MKIMLELFSGTGHMAQAFRQKGWKAFTVDNAYPATSQADVNKLTKKDIIELCGGEPNFIHASPPCFTANELVLTARGHIPICEVKVGDLVLTHKCRWRRVTAIGRKISGTQLLLKGYGSQVRCTKNHPFLIRDITSHVYGPTNKRKSRRVKKIGESRWEDAIKIVGKYWAIPLQTEEIKCHADILDPYTIGRWLGDGWVNVERETIMICTGLNDGDNLEEKLSHSGLKWMRNNEKTSARFTVHDKTLSWWLQSNFRSGAENKLLPGWIFGKDKNYKENLLKGYLDADGHRDEIFKCWKATSISRSLICGIQLLSINIGLTATTVFNPSRKKDHFIEGRKIANKESWGIVIHDYNKERIYFTKMNDNLGYGKVRSRQWKSGKSFVYNLSIDEDETYTINNIVVHNCTAFSVASIGTHWTGGWRAYKPKTETAKTGLALMQKTIDIFNWFPNAKWTMENPRGLMRKMKSMQSLKRHTITFCQYGETRMKPTDVWTNLTDTEWTPRPICKNGDPCHERAPRGSKTGTQGLKNAYLRGALPPQFCDEIAEAASR